MKQAVVTCQAPEGAKSDKEAEYWTKGFLSIFM
jgi:hypothetical protein